MVTRNRGIPGARYFGPYPKVWAVSETLDLMLKAVPDPHLQGLRATSGRWRAAGRASPGRSAAAAAPCSMTVTIEEHRAIVDRFVAFMAGPRPRFIGDLASQMKQAAAAQDYETAAKLRDQLAALADRASRRARSCSPRDVDADVFGIAHDELAAAVQQFVVRGGRVRGVRGWIGRQGARRAARRARRLGAAERVRRRRAAAARDRRARSCPTTPRRSRPGSARHAPTRRRVRAARRAARRQGGAAADGDARTPSRRSCSTRPGAARDFMARSQRARGHPGGARHGRGAAAHRVLRRLAPERHQHRRLDGRLRRRPAAQGPVPPVRDPGLHRRHRLDLPGAHPPAGLPATPTHDEPSTSPTSTAIGADEPATPRRGVAQREQVRLPARTCSSSTAASRRSQRRSRALEEAGVEGITCAASPSGSRRSGLPDADFPVILPRNSDALFLFQRVRDEAHRFAITHQRQAPQARHRHRALRDPGARPARVKELLRHFGSVAALERATRPTIAEVQGHRPDARRDRARAPSRRRPCRRRR